MAIEPPDPLGPPDDDALLARAARAQAELPDAPQAWQRAALALWPSALAQALASGTRLVQAVLRVDSGATGAWALGLRAGASPLRQWLFSAEDHDVELRALAQDGTVHLSGQLLGPLPAGEAGSALPAAEAGSATLAGQAGETRHVAVDEHGGFDFGPVEPGAYRLQLQLPQLRIELPPLDLDGG